MVEVLNFLHVLDSSFPTGVSKKSNFPPSVAQVVQQANQKLNTPSQVHP